MENYTSYLEGHVTGWNDSITILPTNNIKPHLDSLKLKYKIKSDPVKIETIVDDPNWMSYKIFWTNKSSILLDITKNVMS